MVLIDGIYKYGYHGDFFCKTHHHTRDKTYTNNMRHVVRRAYSHCTQLGIETLGPGPLVIFSYFQP